MICDKLHDIIQLLMIQEYIHSYDTKVPPLIIIDRELVYQDNTY